MKVPSSYLYLVTLTLALGSTWGASIADQVEELSGRPVTGVLVGVDPGRGQETIYAYENGTSSTIVIDYKLRKMGAFLGTAGLCLVGDDSRLVAQLEKPLFDPKYDIDGETGDLTDLPEQLYPLCEGKTVLRMRAGTSKGAQRHTRSVGAVARTVVRAVRDGAIYDAVKSAYGRVRDYLRQSGSRESHGAGDGLGNPHMILNFK